MEQSSAMVPITLSLRKTTVDALSSQIQDISLSDWLSTRCRLWVENYVSGSVFLSPDQTRKIEELAGKPIANGNDVVSAIGKTHDIEDGQRTFLLSLDPAYVGPIADRAKEMGIEPADFINNMWSWALDQNWFTYLEPSYQPPVFFPHFAVIQRLTGKDRPTGAEIEKAIGELVTLAKGKHEKPALPPSEDGAEKGLIGNLMASLTGAK